MLPDGLTAQISEPSATVAVGSSITYTLTLTNNSSQAITYTYGGSDEGINMVGGLVSITNSAGKQTFPSTGLTGPAETVSENIASGQSVTATINISIVEGAAVNTSSIDVGSSPFPTAGVYNATATFSGTGTTAANTLPPLAVVAQ
jgi:hypothetical protein